MIGLITICNLKNMNNKKTIGVMFGSKSPEHDISIITGQFIMAELRKTDKYNVVGIYIDKKGNWFLGKELESLKFFTSGDYTEKLKEMSNWSVSTKITNKLVLDSKGMFSKEISIDVVFPALHGQNGEDGAIQGMLEMLSVPYVGCDFKSSSVAMDKVLNKLFYKSINIPTTNFIYFSKKEWGKEKDIILNKAKNELKWPVFVKPANLGSSIAITKVKEYKELEKACELACYYDNKVLIEESVENLMDITCAVIGNEELKSSLVQESTFEKDSLSYEDKYLNDGGSHFGNDEKKIIIPARLNQETTDKIQEMSKNIFKSLGCSGIARVDYLYNKETKELFANEINPLPGTLYHHLWKESGLEASELINKLINWAIEKYKEKNEITYTFKSDVLKHAKGIKLKMNN